MSLNLNHKNILKNSSIEPEFALQNGVFSVESNTKALELVGRSSSETIAPAIAFQYFDLCNRDNVITTSLRPDSPSESGPKYIKQTGQPNRLYIPRSFSKGQVERIETPLIVTEGEKKALSLAQNCPDFVSVSIGGVNNWRTKYNGEKSEPLKEFDQITLKGREVLLCFDSDVMEKWEILQAEISLAEFLRSREAEVRCARI